LVSIPYQPEALERASFFYSERLVSVFSAVSLTKDGPYAGADFDGFTESHFRGPSGGRVHRRGRRAVRRLSGVRASPDATPPRNRFARRQIRSTRTETTAGRACRSASGTQRRPSRPHPQ